MTKTMPNTARPVDATFIARLGNEAVWCNNTNMTVVTAEMRKRNGGGVPQFEKLSTLPVAAPPPVRRGHTVSAEGKTRSTADFDAAVKAGFAPKQSLFERGTMVVDYGVDEARRQRQEFDSLPLVVDYCKDFQATIAAEERRDVTFETGAIRMAASGRLALGRGRYLMEDRGIVGLASRLGCGGGSYLRDNCDPELRAININRQAVRFAEEEKAGFEAAKAAGETKEGEVFEPANLVLRTRKAGDHRSVFAAVSPKYTSFDVDKIAKAIELATPADARGTVHYDGSKARFNVTFHSNVRPEDYVSGEFFSAGAVIEAADDGSGSIKVSASVLQNLCLNLVILDNAVTKIANIRHVGSVEKLAEKFRAAFAAAMEAISHFVKAWGYATKDDALKASLVANGERDAKIDAPLTADEINAALPGLFDAIIDSGKVEVKKHDRKRSDVVADLVDMYREDVEQGSSAVRGGMVSRAAVANAFTRYAHKVEGARYDVFGETEIEKAAGKLLADKRPLPWHEPAWTEKTEATA